MRLKPIPKMKAGRPCNARRLQQGAATLIVVMVLFFIISLVAAYTSRNLIFQQRTANNQYRSTQALEVAEAGLEWAISMLNHGRIDDACVGSTNTANTTFRQRYLDVDDAGRMTARPNAAGGDLLPTCVSNGTGGWTCSCPTTGASTLVPSSTTTQVLPAFRVRFQRIIPSDPVNSALARQPGLVRVQVVGCTRLDASTGDQCLTFNGQGRLQRSASHHQFDAGPDRRRVQPAAGGADGQGCGGHHRCLLGLQHSCCRLRHHGAGGRNNCYTCRDDAAQFARQSRRPGLDH